MNLSSLLNPSDVSELLFRQPSDCSVVTKRVAESVDHNNRTVDNPSGCYVGPISIVQSGTNPKSSPQRGRCLVATRSLNAGELLFVTLPIVQVNVNDVWDEYWNNRTNSLSLHNHNSPTDNSQTTSSSVLANVAEQTLLKACKESIESKQHGVLRCLTSLEGRCPTTRENSHCDGDGNACSTAIATCIARLLGHEIDDESTKRCLCNGCNDLHQQQKQQRLSDDDILQIIRRNAFGSDFPTIYRIEERWMEAAVEQSKESSKVPDQTIMPSRLLGIYGLAAMINHSCVPNAVRVFTGDGTMIVHACQPIGKGEEIVWSYIPVVQSYAERQYHLQQTHNFICQCKRCCAEAMFMSSTTNGISSALIKQFNMLQTNAATTKSNLTGSYTTIHIDDMIHRLENDILKQSALSNEMKRYIRISYIPSYMIYINDVLQRIVIQQEQQQQQQHNDRQVKELQRLLALAFQLHLSFVVCHNVSTEHLSILHLCYDLACMIHTLSLKSDNASSITIKGVQQHECTSTSATTTIVAVRFWTEQLKRAMLIRYGTVGNNIDVVRQLLHHTKQVVRNKDGADHSLYKFI